MSTIAFRTKILYAFILLILLGITLVTIALYPLAGTTLGTAFLALGITLLTSGITSLFFNISARRELGEEITGKISEILSPPVSPIHLGDNRNMLVFQQIIENARRNLDLMGLTLPDITEQGLLPLFSKTIERHGTNIRILLLDPGSEVAKVRAQYSQYQHAESIFATSRSTILRLYRFRSHMQTQGIEHHKLDVRLYTQLPLCLTITDDSLILSLYVLDVLGQHAPFIQLTGQSYNSALSVTLQQHFDKVWNLSKSIFQMTESQLIQFFGRISDKGN